MSEQKGDLAMSAKKYRFVSPGIFLSEIDQSQLSKVPNPIGPVVIGRTQRGPGMRPVTVNSFLDFVEVFGNPIPGGEGGDVWRDGNRTSPTYASYAARAWLKNGSPVTIVRVLGEANSAAASGGEAGWSTTKTTPTPAVDSNGGAFGLFITPSASVGESLTGTLAAVFYLDEGSIRLQGTNTAGTDVSGAAELVVSSGDSYGFKAIIQNGDLVLQITSSFNFDKDSDLYIRKVFNTDPTLMSANTNTIPATYFLGETFERSLFDTNGTTPAESGEAFAFIAGLTSGAVREVGAQAATTGMVMSQKLTSSGNAESLFKLTALDSGEWANSNLKTSISDIAAPTSPDFDPYGTFTVEVRDARDSDAKKQVLETFTGCNLNPNSPNFVAVKIGDKYTTWSDTERRFTEFGDYNNNSKYVYVTMEAPKDPALIPFGFVGAQTFADATGSLNANDSSTAILDLTIPHTASAIGITAISASDARTDDNITCTG